MFCNTKDKNNLKFLIVKVVETKLRVMKSVESLSCFVRVPGRESEI